MSREFNKVLLIGTIFADMDHYGADHIIDDMEGFLSRETINGYDLVVVALGDKFQTYSSIQSLVTKYDDSKKQYIEEKVIEAVREELLETGSGTDFYKANFVVDVHRWVHDEIQNLIYEMSTGLKLVFFMPPTENKDAWSWLSLEADESSDLTNQRGLEQKDDTFQLLQFPWREWSQDGRLTFKSPLSKIMHLKDLLLAPDALGIGNTFFGPPPEKTPSYAAQTIVNSRVVATSVLNSPRVLHFSTTEGGECILAPLPNLQNLQSALEHLQYGRFMTGSAKNKHDTKRSNKEWFYEAFDEAKADPQYKGWSNRKIIEDVIMTLNGAQYVYETYNGYLKER